MLLKEPLHELEEINLKENIAEEPIAHFQNLPPADEPDIELAAPEAVHEITPDVVLSNHDEPLLIDYYRGLNFEQARDVHITLRSVLINAPVILGCLILAGIAASVYYDPAKEYAEGDPVKEFLYVSGALFYNILLSWYFENELVAPLWASLFENDIPPEVLQARCNLEDKSSLFWPRIGRWTKDIAVMGAIIIPSIGTAVPTYALDVRSGHATWRSKAVLWATVPLMYASTKWFTFTALGLAMAPINLAYRKLSKRAMNNYRLESTLNAFKAAHLDAIDGAHQEILRCLQVGEYDKITPIMRLLAKPNRTVADTYRLSQMILRMTPKSTYQYNTTAMSIMQWASLVITAVSVEGLFPLTRNTSDEFFHIHDFWESILVASAIFTLSVAIGFKFSWDTFGSLYRIAEYAGHGIKEAVKRCNGFKDCLVQAWEHRADKHSWYNIIQLSLPAIQNPKAMVGAQVGLTGYSYFSIQTTLLITLKIWFFLLCAGIGVMVFNSYPLTPVLGALQVLFMLTLGTEEKIEQIRLDEFMKNYKRFVGEMAPKKFLGVMNGFINNEHVTQEQSEEQCKLFLGDKTSEEILDKTSDYRGLAYTKIIPELTKRNVEALNVFGLFANADDKEAQKRLNQEYDLDYGTIRSLKSAENGSEKLEYANSL